MGFNVICWVDGNVFVFVLNVLNERKAKTVFHTFSHLSVQFFVCPLRAKFKYFHPDDRCSFPRFYPLKQGSKDKVNGFEVL